MKIPVLVYHDIVSSNELRGMSARDRFYTITWDRFDQHLRFLVEKAFQTVRIGGAAGENRNPVVLTFDDGLKSAYRCHQDLLKFGFNGVFFITTDFVGREGYLSWEEIREMDDNGMSIQSHTCSHPILSGLGPDRIRTEFSLSKATIEDMLGHGIDSLSIPQGFSNREITGIARECGYDHVYTSHPGLYAAGSRAPIPRLSIYNETSNDSFRRLVCRSSREIAGQRARKLILSVPKILLGHRNYHLVRQRILRWLDR